MNRVKVGKVAAKIYLRDLVQGDLAVIVSTDLNGGDVVLRLKDRVVLLHNGDYWSESTIPNNFYTVRKLAPGETVTLEVK